MRISQSVGGGEDAYREALRRLKQSCGRRDVIKLANLYAIDRLEPGKGRNFLMFAEQVRSHLFELDRTGNASAAEVIEKIYTKLSTIDRVAWKEGMQGHIETRSIKTFGDWLATHANNYLSAYDMQSEVP